jgi:regulator of replication initiation timing
MEIRINEDDHLDLLQQLKHLRKQRDELQAHNTRLALENRDLRRIALRLPEYPGPLARELMWLESLGDENDKAEFAREEVRRAEFWKGLR